jgi:hypothetical protein
MPNTVWIVHEPRIEAEHAPMADHHIEGVIRHRTHSIASELEDQPQSRQIPGVDLRRGWDNGIGGSRHDGLVELERIPVTFEQ